MIDTAMRHDAQPPRIRCAIYTRKSTEEGLEQEFSSLDAQREAAEAYIASQRHEGWQCLPQHYDDGGYTGGNMERPALKQLLADIAAGRIDCVVVYKVDRLSRSLMDFTQLMALFDQHKVSFVSVTQQFNTTTSMGRLTLNILLSFAQFEREIGAERVRDKIAAAKRKGKNTGGPPILGYDMAADDETIRILVPIKMRTRAGRREVITTQGPLAPQEALMRAVARAYIWQALLDAGEVSSIEALATRFRVDRSYVARILRLASLAPDLVEMIANGDEPNGLSLRQLMKGFPVRWDEQKTELCSRRNVSGRGRGI